MNRYQYTFVADCPNNSEPIVYQLEITSRKQIFVEHIKTACALHRRGFHELIAADLHSTFGGRLRLTANHHGVDIETTLPNPEPPALNPGDLS